MLKSSLRLDDKAVSEELRSADQDYRQDTLFEAVVTVGAIVAVSDGLAEDCERNELAAFVGTRPGLETYTPDETLDAFESRVREFEMVGGLANALHDLRKVADRDGVRTVLAAGDCIAAADGDVHFNETTALRLVRLSIKST